MRLGLLLLLSLIAGLGCDGGLELTVDLKTDYVPGIEFSQVATEVLWGGGGARADTAVDAERDGLLGIRVAEIGGSRRAPSRFARAAPAYCDPSTDCAARPTARTRLSHVQDYDPPELQRANIMTVVTTP